MRWLTSLVLLAACSGSSESSSPDAAPMAADAYDTARCLIKGDYGDAGAFTGTAGMNQGATTMTATLEPGTARDAFFIKMVPGRGVFAGGVAPGTYTIAGVDAGYSTCGLCVHIIADITSSGPSKFYFARSGTVTFTSTTAPIAGSAQNLHFAEVDINSGAEVAGGCQGSITSISFSTP
jgi:hypothetical protein